MTVADPGSAPRLAAHLVPVARQPRTDRSGNLTCPMPGCEEPLLLVFTEALALDLDVLGSIDAVRSSDSTTGTWKVECLADHVVVLPDTSGCPCAAEDQQEPEVCPHDPDDYEWSDEGPMRFRNIDRRRLIALVEQLDGTTDPTSQEAP